MDASLIARFVARVDSGEPDECWPWLGATDKRGYGFISAGDRRMERTHRLAHKIWNGPLAPGEAVLHLCDNPSCCNPRHLRAGTQAENMAEMNARGRRGGDGLPFGEAHGRAKLDASKVREIRRLYAAGGMSHRALARRFGVAKSQISSVLNGRTWSHVEQEA